MTNKKTHNLTGEASRRRVWLNGEELSPEKSQKIINYSPDGFNWGYCGSGPAQLALSILLELVPVKIAVKYYQRFKERIIATLPRGQSFNKDFAMMSHYPNWNSEKNTSSFDDMFIPGED